MNRLTYGDVKTIVAKAAGINLTPSSRVAQYLNEATQRLMNRGKWVGTYGRFRICVSEGCLTWPRQVETIEAYAVCNRPGTIRSEWFEFQESGPGLLDADHLISNTLVDRGMACVFNDITRGVTNRKIKVYADVDESVHTSIIIQGYDENGQWIRTRPGGVGTPYIDGEQIAILSASATSDNFFTAITGVIKDETKGFVRLYEYNTDTAANTQALAVYEPDETRPVYRRSFIPGLENLVGSGDCENVSVTVSAKLKFIPVSGSDDNQWVMIGNLAALKLAVQGIVFEEKNMPSQAEIYLGKAVRELDVELQTFLGDGVVHTPRIVGFEQWGGGGVGSINSPYYL